MPIKILMSFFTEILKFNPKIHMEAWMVPKSKSNPEQTEQHQTSSYTTEPQ
jgi:hypothetical protein